MELQVLPNFIDSLFKIDDACIERFVLSVQRTEANRRFRPLIVSQRRRRR
jgi:hypothetical protein